MIVNLKQINLSDSDNIKLDKINYNFDQLVANGGGPMGTTGPVGAQGATGITGAQGYQGPIGPTGVVGAPGLNTTAYWKNTAGGGNVPVDTILPLHDPLSNLHSPVVSVGFMGGDAEYGAGQNVLQGQIPYQWIINRKSNFAHNLRFTSSDVLNNSFNFKMENLGSINTFTMGFQNVANNTPTSIIWHAQNHIFIDNTSGSPLLEIRTSGITYHKDVEFDRPVTVNGPLKIGNANAAQDKIAVASDNNGTVTFKSIDELGGIVPYGTIVSILPSVFNNPNNFIINETVTLADASDLLKIGVGRGINDYSGWYICNGETWKSDSVSPQLVELTPNLNSFSYTIEDNPDSISLTSQGSVNSPNTDVHIVGGSDISMSAAYGGPGGLAGMYSISSTVSTTDTPITTYSGSTFKIKKLPQIIYLGVDDAYWQKLGTGQAPMTNNTYYIDDLNNGVTGSLTASTVRNNQQGSTDQFTIRVYAANGYYFDTLPSGGDFTATSNGYSIIGIQGGNGAYTLFVELTISATQTADNTDRWFTWNSSAFVAQIPISTVRYSVPSWYSSVDAITNGSVLNVYDLGATPTGTPVLMTDGWVTAATGSERYIKYVVIPSVNYAFLDPTLTGFAYYPVNQSSHIVEYSVTDVDGDGTYIEYVVKDTNFGQVNPGGSSTTYAAIQATATSLAPKLTDGVYKYNSAYMGGPGALTTDTLAVINNTGTDKYIYITINNFTMGSSGNDTVGAMWNGLSAGAAPGNMVSDGYVLLMSGSVATDVIEIYPGGDTAYEVYLQWSNTIGGPLTIINY